MNKILILVLKTLKAMFGQDALWEAVRAVVEVRGKIKLAKFELEKEEGAQLREIEWDIMEARKAAKLKKIDSRHQRKEKRKEKRAKD